jgi:hypothetical protein
MAPLSVDAAGPDAPSRAAAVLQLVLETLPSDNDKGGDSMDTSGAVVAMVLDMLQTSIGKFDDVHSLIGTCGHSQVRQKYNRIEGVAHE